MADYPIAKICPKCGGTTYDKKAPGGFMPAFTMDRVCKNCGTRYTPPTPAWAAIVFIVIGAILALGAGLAILVSIQAPKGMPPACEIVLGLAGVACVIYGIKSFSQRPVDTPTSGFLAPPAPPEQNPSEKK